MSLVSEIRGTTTDPVKKAMEILRVNKNENFLMIATDIMEFKLVNNLFGEQVGNEVLKMQAALISSRNLPNSIYGRISGDKFAVLLPKACFDVNTVTQNNMTLQQTVSKYNYKLQSYTGVYAISDRFENPKLMYDKAAMTIETIRGSLEKAIAFMSVPAITTIHWATQRPMPHLPPMIVRQIGV